MTPETWREHLILLACVPPHRFRSAIRKRIKDGTLRLTIRELGIIEAYGGMWG